MAGEIASAYLSIYPKLESSKVVDEIGKSMSGAGKSAGKAFSSSASGAMQSGMGGAGSAGANALANGFSVAKVALGNIIADVATSAANEFKERFGDGIEQSDAMQKFASTMSFAGFDTAQIDAVRIAMKDYADQTVYDLGEVMDTTAKLAANGVKDYDTLVQAAGNLNAAAGGNSESFGYFANAITQVNGAGKLMSQDWNQIVNALPGASGAIQNELKEMGAWDDSMGTFKDALAAGEVTADEFNAALSNLGMTDVAQEAATSTSTFEGAMGQMDAAITNTMQGIYDSLNEDGRITDAINGMASAFESISPVLSDVADAVGDFVQSGIEAAAPVISDLASTLGDLASSGLEAVTPLVTALADAFGQFISFIQPALPVIAGIVAGIAGMSVITSIIGAISGAVGFLTTVIIPAISMIGSIPGLIAVIMSVLGGPITIIGAIIGAIVAFIATNEDMRNKVMEVFGVVRNTVLGALNTVLNIVNSVWPAIRAIIGSTLGVIKSLVQTNFNIIKTIITTAMNVVRSIVAAVSAAMQGNWSGALNAMKSAVSAAIGGIRSIFGTLRGAVMGALSGIGGWLVGAGQDLIQGLVNGISGAVGWVTNAVSNLCSNALSTLKGFFGIGSPSRLMREMGGYLMQGLAIGIDDGTVQATRAMGSASETIANALGLNADGMARYGVAAQPTSGATVYNVYLNDLAVNDDVGIVNVTRDYLVGLSRLGAI